jgi:hypothetical protein
VAAGGASVMLGEGDRAMGNRFQGSVRVEDGQTFGLGVGLGQHR